MDDHARGSSSALLRPRFAALPADLYGGTSGIALFLAELAVVTSDRKSMQTAAEAARHALAQARVSIRHGFYAGTTGALWAVLRVAFLLDDASLLEAADRCSTQTILALQDDTKSVGFDMVDGLAGTVVGWLALSRRSSDHRFIEAAKRLGNELSERGEQQLRGIAWKLTPSQKVAPTGFAHGTSGAALALAELGAATQDDRYREAALEAMRYERRWRDADRGWVDIRLAANERVQPGTLPTSESWCYGSTGALATRLGANDIVADEALAAVQTAEGLTRDLANPTDWSLCHGVTGSAEMLMHAQVAGGKTLGGETIDLARQVANEACRRWQSGELPFVAPSGRISYPGLMVGASGLGLFLLRQAKASVTSVLIPTLQYLQPRESLDLRN